MLTLAICTYNRSERLRMLLAAVRRLPCPTAFEVLVIDNNSNDDTAQVIAACEGEPGPKVRYVLERNQGITFARNRAINESLTSDYLVFIDDDELPGEGLLAAAYDALATEQAQCVGGRIVVDFGDGLRPKWLSDSLLGFLGAVDHCPDPLWVVDDTTPVWSGNVGYDMNVFRTHPELRFDVRYNRAGPGIGGGSDLIMFNTFLKLGLRIRYRPDMSIHHLVDAWKLKRRYFVHLHHLAGYRSARWASVEYGRSLFGVPPFLVAQAIRATGYALGAAVIGREEYVRTAMTAAFAWGMVRGRLDRWRLEAR